MRLGVLTGGFSPGVCIASLLFAPGFGCHSGVSVAPADMVWFWVLLDSLGHVKLAAFTLHLAGFWDQTSGCCSRGGSTTPVAFNIVSGNRCLWVFPSQLCCRTR